MSRPSSPNCRSLSTFWKTESNQNQHHLSLLIRASLGIVRIWIVRQSPRTSTFNHSDGILKLVLMSFPSLEQGNNPVTDTRCPEPCPASCNHPLPMVNNAWDHKCLGLSPDAKAEWRKQMWRATRKALRSQWSDRHGSAMPTTGWGDSASDSSSVEGNQKRRKGTTDVANSSTKRRRILSAKDNAPFHPHESGRTRSQLLVFLEYHC